MATELGASFIDPQTVLSACRQVTARGRSDAVVVGLSAAALWGMPVPPSEAARIAHGAVSVSRSSSDRAWRGRRIEGHSIALPAEHLTEIGPLAVTTPPRTWLDCAALVSPDHLLALGDWALGRGILTISGLESLINWGRGRRGVMRAREVAPLLRHGVESPQESRLRWLVVSHGLPEPTINPEIVLPDMSVRRIDLAYQGLRVGLEFDGDWHARTQDHDERRRAALADEGWEILVARKDDLVHPDRFLRQVRSALARRSQGGRRRW